MHLIPQQSKRSISSKQQERAALFGIGHWLVDMAEVLRFTGKIWGATVSCTADRWFVAIQRDVPDVQAKKARTSHGIVGVDFGIKAAATLSTGESILSPTPLKSALRRLKIHGRSLSRKIKTRKKEQLSFDVSKNQKKSSLKLARQHARIANLRADFSHKLTTLFAVKTKRLS